MNKYAVQLTAIEAGARDIPNRYTRQGVMDVIDSATQNARDTLDENPGRSVSELEEITIDTISSILSMDERTTEVVDFFAQHGVTA